MSTYLEKDMDAEMKELEEDESDDDNEDDDESDNDEAEVDPEVLKKINDFEEEIKANPYNYGAHTEIIELLKKTDDFDKLRTCRKHFSELYPLTGEMWISWVRDELKIAVSEDDKKFVEELFNKGVKDYLSVDLWLEFCQYSISGIGTKEGIDKARDIHERAITACGFHVSKGALIWETYREFELALLSMLASEGSEEQVKAHTEQKIRVENIFKRQLRQPLFNMETTLDEYKQFVGNNIDQNVVITYHKARDKLKSREEFEHSLSKDDPSLEDFKAYTEFELKEKDPARIQVIYERAVSVHCLVTQVWEDYLSYLDSNLKISSVSLPVYERAIRNCPWSVEIWSRYLRAMERYETPHKQLVAVFEQGLAAGFSDPSSYLSLWLTFIDYSRRRTEFSSNEVTQTMSDLRTVFERAIEHLAKCGGDPDMEVVKYLASLEADQFGNMENARVKWADIVQVHPYTASVWLEFIQLEKTFGDKKHLRKAYQRALEKVFDNPEVIIKSYTQFEREEGSLEAFENCLKLTNLKMAKVEQQRMKGKSKEDEMLALQEAKIEKKKEKDKQYRRDKRQAEAAVKKENTQNGKKEEDVFVKPNVPENMKPKQAVKPPPGYQGDRTKVPPPPGFNENNKRSVPPPPGYKGGEEPANKKQKTDINEDTSVEGRKLRTVFVSNLDFEVTENDIQEFMSSSGTVVEVRLVKHPTGKSKGYAFVEFEKKEDAEGAKARDNELMGKRPVYISECDPEKKTGFKFTVGLEKKKLFIKGLDPEVTKPELVEIFEKFGKLAAVRIVTYRNGHSKGIAFIEYEEEVSAATALVKTDNMKVRGQEIEVALSNPPKRKEEAAADIKSLGGTVSTDFGPRGKGKGSQLAFTPRSLVTQSSSDKMKLQPMKFVKPGASTAKSSEADDKVTDSNGTATKSNADFRKMFLQQ